MEDLNNKYYLKGVAETIKEVKFNLKNFNYSIKNLIFFIFILISIIFYFRYILIPLICFFYMFFFIFFSYKYTFDKKFVLKIWDIIELIQCNNNIIFFLYFYIIQQPVILSYLYFYKTIYILFIKDVNKNLNFLNLNNINYLFITLFFRFLINLILGIPIHIVNKSFDVFYKITATLKLEKKINYQSFKNLLFNIILMHNDNIKFIKDSLIIYKGGKDFYINPPKIESDKRILDIVFNVKKIFNKNIIYKYCSLKNDLNLYPRNYFFINFKEPFEFNKQNCICTSLSTHKEAKVKVLSSFFKNPVKAYWEFTYKQKSINDRLIKQVHDSFNLEKTIKNQWVTNSYFINSNDIKSADEEKHLINSIVILNYPEIKNLVSNEVIKLLFNSPAFFDNDLGMFIDKNKSSFISFLNDDSTPFNDSELNENILNLKKIEKEYYDKGDLMTFHLILRDCMDNFSSLYKQNFLDEEKNNDTE